MSMQYLSNISLLFIIFIWIFFIRNLFHYSKIRLYEGFFSLFIILLIFFLIRLLLPAQFAPDQIEYFVGSSSEDLKFSVASYKFMGLWFASHYSIHYLGFTISELQFLLFLYFLVPYIYFVSINGSMLLGTALLFLMPSVLIHAGLYLREPLAYIFIVIFFISIKKDSLLLGLLALFATAVIRPDFSIILSCFLGMFLKNRNMQTLFFISFITLSYYVLVYSEFSQVLKGYRSLFGMPEFTLTIGNLLTSFFNVLVGKKDFSIETIILSIETIFLLFMIYFSRDRKVILCALFVVIILVGSVSDNSGFILRIRSVLILSSFCVFLLNLSNNFYITSRKEINVRNSGNI